MALLVAAPSGGAWFAAEPGAPRPWRVAEAAGAPAWLRFGLQNRVRHGSLDDDFPAAATGDAPGFAFPHARLSAEAATEVVTARVELIDARAEATTRTRLDTGKPGVRWQTVPKTSRSRSVAPTSSAAASPATTTRPTAMRRSR